MFDLKNPAADRGMPFTCVVERPDLQEILLSRLDDGVVTNAAGVQGYHQESDGPVTITLEDGETVSRGFGGQGCGSARVCAPSARMTCDETPSTRQMTADVLIGADGIWSSVRSTMHKNEPKGDTSGATYSGVPQRVYARPVAASRIANPKSHSLT